MANVKHRQECVGTADARAVDTAVAGNSVCQVVLPVLHACRRLTPS